MTKLNLPVRFDKAYDDTGAGAILKRVTADRRAIVVDFEPNCGNAIACRVRDLGDYCPSHPSDYALFLIDRDEARKWLLLTSGSDEVLED